MTRARWRRRHALLAVAGLSILLASGPARAFCREVTKAAPPGYSPAEAGCYTTDPEAGVLPQLYWANQCVNFNLNRGASRQISLNQAGLIATQAFAQWNAAACTGGPPSIRATQGPDVDCDDQSAGHNNPIIFRDTGWTHSDTANAIGYTTLTVDTVTGEIYGAEIEINTELHTIVPTTPPPPGDYDLPSILTHEAGHFLGLAHAADPTAVMFALYHSGSTTLQPDDVTGICSIYPSDGTRNTMSGAIAGASCNTEPTLGFDDFCGDTDASTRPPPAQTGSDAGVQLTESLFGCTTGGAFGRGGACGAMVPALIALGMVVRRKWRRVDL